MEDFQKRLIEEYVQLKGRIEKLKNKLSEQDIQEKLSSKEVELLEKQHIIMMKYSSILYERIIYYIPNFITQTTNIPS